MIREWRVFSEDGQGFPAGYDGIVIGDESCVYRARHKSQIDKLAKVLKQGISVRYVTPIIPDQEIEPMFDFIKDLSLHIRPKVTFNDYGLLYRCLGMIKEKRITPVLGRILTRSIIDCPWFEEILANEKADVRNATVGYTFNHDAKLKVLERFCIEEVELNFSGNAGLEILRQKGLKLAGYTANSLISTGRICYTARWYGMNMEECRNDGRCRKKLFIELSRKWGKKSRMFEKPTEDIKHWFNGMYICGNSVYRNEGNRPAFKDQLLFDILIFN